MNIQGFSYVPADLQEKTKSFFKEISTTKEDAFNATVPFVLSQLPEECKLFFTKWLNDKKEFIGSSVINPSEFFKKTFYNRPLYPSNTFSPEKIEAFLKIVEPFFRDIQIFWSPFHRVDRSLPMEQKNVAISYSTHCGCGHKSPALAISDFLKENGYVIHIFNSETMPKTSDLLLKKITDLNIHLFISTVAHDFPPTRQALYDAEVPAIVVNTDYMFPSALVNGQIFRIENSSFIKYATPPLSADETWIRALKDNLPSRKYEQLVSTIGFPVRKSFQRETSLEKVMEIRSHLNISSTAHVLLVMAHRDTEEHLSSFLIKKLEEEKLVKEIHLCIVVENEAKKAELEKISFKNPHLTMTVLLPLEEEQLASYMKVVSRAVPQPLGAMFSKRGGSTTAEAAEMGVYTFLHPSLDTAEEITNGKYLIQQGLGELLLKESFNTKILLKALNCKLATPPKVKDWKKGLLSLVEMQISRQKKALQGTFSFQKDDIPGFN